MKKRIIAGIGGLVIAVSVCLFIILTLPWHKSASAGRGNLTSVMARSRFYFGTGQWLADIRTVAAGVRYLCSSRITQLLRLADATPVLPSIPGLGLSNSVPAFGEGDTIRFVGRRLTRAERMNGRYEWSGVCGLPPRFALADFSYGVSGVCSFSSLSVTSGVPQRWARPAQVAPPATGHSSGGVTATNLEGV